MSFSMKPTVQATNGTSNISNDEWNSWNEYLWSCIEGDEVIIDGKKVKSEEYQGVVNYILDLGYQPQSDAEYDTKFALPTGDEENSAEELAHIDKYPTNYFKWVDDGGVRKRKQCRPQRPEQEVAISLDFPEVLVDYSKHPVSSSSTPDVKPLRVSLNGWYKDNKRGIEDFTRHIAVRLNREGKLSDKNMLYKIADKGGVLQQFIDSEYDLGSLVQATSWWSLKAVMTDQGFLNLSVKDPSKLKRNETPMKVDVPFVGILLNGGEYPADNLKHIRSEHKKVLARATSFKPSPEKYPDFVLGCDWLDSDLSKALEATQKSPKSEGKQPQEEAPKAAQKAVQEQSTASEPEPEDGFDFEDDIPFAPIGLQYGRQSLFVL